MDINGWAADWAASFQSCKGPRPTCMLELDGAHTFSSHALAFSPSPIEAGTPGPVLYLPEDCSGLEDEAAAALAWDLDNPNPQWHIDNCSQGYGPAVCLDGAEAVEEACSLPGIRAQGGELLGSCPCISDESSSPGRMQASLLSPDMPSLTDDSCRATGGAAGSPLAPFDLGAMEVASWTPPWNSPRYSPAGIGIPGTPSGESVWGSYNMQPRADAVSWHDGIGRATASPSARAGPRDRRASRAEQEGALEISESATCIALRGSVDTSSQDGPARHNEVELWGPLPSCTATGQGEQVFSGEGPSGLPTVPRAAAAPPSPSKEANISDREETRACADAACDRGQSVKLRHHSRPPDLTGRLALALFSKERQLSSLLCGSIPSTAHPNAPRGSSQLARSARQEALGNRRISLLDAALMGTTFRGFVLGGHGLDLTLCVDALEGEDGGELQGTETKRRRRDVSDDWRIAKLIEVAEAQAGDDEDRMAPALCQLAEEASPSGTVGQRIVFCFLQALRLRTAGGLAAEDLLRPMELTPWMIGALEETANRIPYLVVCMDFTNYVLEEVCTTQQSVHIVDLGMWTGQWEPFFRILAERRPNSPSRVRITGVTAPPGTPYGTGPGQLPARFQAEVTAGASKWGVECQCQVIEQRLENLTAEELGIALNPDRGAAQSEGEGEVLAVICNMRLHQVPDGTVLRSSPRDRLLQKFKDWGAKRVVICCFNTDQNSQFYMARFKEAVRHFLLLFSSFEAMLGRHSLLRHVIESKLLLREVQNVVACEGLQRFSRRETMAMWQARMRRLHFVPQPIKPARVEMLRSFAEKFHPDVGLAESGGGLSVTWRGQSVVMCQAWDPGYH